MADRSVRIANEAKVTMRAHTRHAPRANSGKRRQFPPGAAGRMLCSAPTEIPIGGVGPTRRTTSGRHCWGPELIVRLGNRDDNDISARMPPGYILAEPIGLRRGRVQNALRAVAIRWGGVTPACPSRTPGHRRRHMAAPLDASQGIFSAPPSTVEAASTIPLAPSRSAST